MPKPIIVGLRLLPIFSTIGSTRSERGERRILVLGHQPRVAHDIGCENRGKAAD